MTNPYQAPAAQVQGGMSNCKGCGKEIHSQAATCPNCGLTQRSRGYKSKGLAGALALLIGGFGIHRFYLGQWWGVFYLLLFWTAIPGLISIIEAIVMWCTNDNTWDARHNEGRPAAPNEQSGAGTIVVIIVAIFIVGIMFLGILASVAIPAYQDYTVRAKVSNAIAESASVRAEYENYYESNGSTPQSNADLGLQNPSLLASGDQLTITESGFSISFLDETFQLKDKFILFEPYQGEYSIEWDCSGGSLEARFRPVSCRLDRESLETQ